jgi:hypothetical protein
MSAEQIFDRRAYLVMIRPAFDEPLEVSPVEGEIAITGPDGLCGSFTVQAAIASAQRLLDAVEILTGSPPPGRGGEARQPN